MNLILFTYIKKWCEEHIHFVQIWTCQISVMMIIETGLHKPSIRSIFVTKKISPWSSTMTIVNGCLVNNYVLEWPKLTIMHGNDKSLGILRHSLLSLVLVAKQMLVKCFVLMPMCFARIWWWWHQVWWCQGLLQWCICFQSFYNNSRDLFLFWYLFCFHFFLVSSLEICVLIVVFPIPLFPQQNWEIHKRKSIIL
jgi:hypothetical protein